MFSIYKLKVRILSSDNLNSEYMLNLLEVWRQYVYFTTVFISFFGNINSVLGRARQKENKK